jgi:Concanavalin A-like lectin/glucanases superfamily
MSTMAFRFALPIAALAALTMSVWVAARELPTLPTAAAEQAAPPSNDPAQCLLATDVYRVNPPSYQAPVRLYEVDAATGSATMPRTTGAPPLIGLAWGPGNALYGVSTLDNPSGFQPNALYRIDPATGATTLIGATGLTHVHEGDMATDPATGIVYGISDSRLFRFPNLTTNNSDPTAQLVATVSYPPFTTWDISGIAFDPNGQLYAVFQDHSTSPAPLARLIRINPSNGSVQLVAQLSQSLHALGGLEFLGSRLYYTEGHEPNNGSTSNNLYSLYEINVSTGMMMPKGSTNIPGGASSLVSCAPQVHACVPPPPDMDAWYPMDGTGADLVLSKNAVPSGPVSYFAGMVGPAVNLANRYLTIAAGPVLNEGLGDFSIDAWVYVSPSDSGLRPLLDKRTGTTVDNVRGWAMFTSSGHLGLQLGDGSGFTNYADGRTLSGSGWRHLAVTVDRDNPQGLRFYINGVGGALINPTARQGSLDNTSPTFVGRNALGGAITPNLRIDEVEFFDRALAGWEIASIYGAGSYGKCKT